jgi:hypothetical protein
VGGCTRRKQTRHETAVCSANLPHHVGMLHRP